MEKQNETNNNPKGIADRIHKAALIEKKKIDHIMYDHFRQDRFLNVEGISLY